ncbi:unnamed protein product [Knipowitschia caucasica]
MAKPENKRGRSELSSSGTEEESMLTTEMQSIKDALDGVNSKLQKLDMLNQLSEDVKDMKQSLEFYIAMVDVLKQENASLRLEVNNLKHLTTELQGNTTKMSESILDLQSRSMRDNIIIHGVHEIVKEAYQVTEQLVKKFMTEQLKMEQTVVQNIQFARAHRIGKPKGAKDKPRPIVAKLAVSKDKSTIMARGRELKGSTFSITDQFPPEIMKRRRLLYPVMSEARKNDKKTRLIVDKLYIDGALYRKSQITYWLTGGDDAGN